MKPFDPIWVLCEGSGCPVNCSTMYSAGQRTCAMCGRGVDEWFGNAEQHYRQDILAMIARGDFDD